MQISLVFLAVWIAKSGLVDVMEIISTHRDADPGWVQLEDHVIKIALISENNHLPSLFWLYKVERY